MDETSKLEQNPPLKQTAVMRRFSDVLVEIDGQIIPIRDLPKHEYEAFLNDMHKLRLAYISVVGRP
jgi:hypothetical protein